MKKAVIYARFSAHSQTEQSIEGQIKECQEFAERNDYIVVGTYIDRAISGKTDNRPEFQRMIADSNKKQFQYVIVYQLDRFTRSRYDSAIYKAKLKKNGVRVLSARENITADASGIILESMLEGMAEYYSEELSQKVRRGMDLNAAKGLSTGGNVALGYKVNDDKTFSLCPLTAPIVEKIFKMYSSGAIMADITRYLNENNIKTSRGNEFNKNSIRRILTNKRYIGIYTYKGTETKGSIPRIVSDKMFYEVQAMIEKNKKAPARAKADDEGYILTTKLFCGHCERQMVGVSGTSKTLRSYYYYQCVGNRQKVCNKKTVQKDYIEDIVVNETRKILTDKNIKEIAKNVLKYAEKEKKSSNIPHIEKLMRNNKKSTANLLKSLEKGVATDTILKRISELEAELLELQSQKAIEKTKFIDITIEEIEFFITQFKNGDVDDFKYRKGLIDTFVSRIYLYDDKIDIYYNTTPATSSTHKIESSYLGTQAPPNEKRTA
jgi:DNA invertase Pin-like site-specific DNA recombinase